MNTYLAISSLLNFLAAAIQIVIFASSKDRSRIRITYMTFLSLIAAWSGTYYLWRLAADAGTAEFFCKLLISAAIFEPVAFFHFSLALSGLKAKRSIIAGYAGALLFVCMVPFDLIVDGVSARMGHAYWPNAGLMMPLYLLFFNGFLAASVVVLYRGWTRNIGGKASDHLIVLFSGAIGFIGGGTNFPLWYDIPIQPYGNVLVSVYLFLLVHGLYHNRLFGLSLDFYKTLTGLALNVSVTLFYLVFLVLYKSKQGITIYVEDLLLHGIIGFFVSTAAFWGVPRLKFWSEHILDGVFRQKQASTLSLLNDLPNKLSSLADLTDIYELVASTIRDSLDVSGVAVFHLQPFESDYTCMAIAGNFRRKIEEYRMHAEDPLFDGLSQSPQCIIFDQIHEELPDDVYASLVRLKKDFDINSVVPIYTNREIYGLILIQQQGQTKAISEEEISALFHVGTQIGLNLRVRELERQSNEEKKLVALGTMAAGLAHEIRNPLVSVQTLAYTIQKGKSLEDVSTDFKDVLLRDVKRIGSIVEGVARYSQNQQGKMAPIDIEDVVRSSFEIYTDSIEQRHIEVRNEKDFDGTIFVQANFDQLQQVFNNLIENAIHAMENQPFPEITIEMHKREVKNQRGYTWIEVSVMDNGTGIPRAIQDRIFDPFITSKDTGPRQEKKGMGLGLAISQRIMENHLGAINVYNNPTGGARFVVSLRVYDHKL